MNINKLAWNVISAAAIILGGCSGDNRISAPGESASLDLEKDMVEVVTPAGAENNSVRIAVTSDETGIERLSFIARVLKTDVEGGCWYLSSESGDNYTPVTPKSLSLELGMKLAASGYIDKDIHFFCGNGPAFVIEKYKILNKSDEQSEDRASGDSDQHVDAATEDRAPKNATEDYKQKWIIKEAASQFAAEDKAPTNTSQLVDAATEDRVPQDAIDDYKQEWIKKDLAPQFASEDRAPSNTNRFADISTEVLGDQVSESINEPEFPQYELDKPLPIYDDDMQLNSPGTPDVLEGRVKLTKESCVLLETNRKELFELQHDMDVVLEEGTFIQVSGHMVTLLYVGCSNHPAFYVDRMEIISYPKKQLVNDTVKPAVQEDAPEAIEAEGLMYRTEPEGTCWYFETDQKERFELLFPKPVDLRSGMRLRIKGISADVSTFCNAGKPLEVVGWETVNENKF